MAYNPTAIDKKYISSIHLLDQPELLNQVLEVQNEDKSFLDVMDALRRRVPVKSAKFHHFVNKPYYDTITGVGTDWTQEGVRDGDVIAVNTQAASADALAQDVFYIKNAADISTAEPISASARSAGRALVGDEVFTIVSNAHGEGSGGPAPIRFDLKKYEGKIQIFKESYEITDIEYANQLNVSFKGDPYYMIKAQHDAFLKFGVSISAALIFNPNVSSSFDGFDDDTSTAPKTVNNNIITDNDGGNRVQFTRGLDSWTAEGFDQSAEVGSTILVKLDKASKVKNTIRCPKNYLIFCGTEANNAADNDIKGLNVTTTNPAGHRINVDGSNQDFTLDTFTIYGRTYRKMWLPMIDHEIGQAFLGTNYSKTVYYIPEGKIKAIGEDSAQDRMRVRYLEKGDMFSFGYREKQLGGLANPPTSKDDKLEVVYSSYQGLQILGAEHFGKDIWPKTS